MNDGVDFGLGLIRLFLSFLSLRRRRLCPVLVGNSGDCSFTSRGAGAPTLAVRLIPNHDSVRRGDDLEVRCDVTGDPSALVSWRRIGGALSRNAQVLGNLLRYTPFSFSINSAILFFSSVHRVTDVKPENGGVYRCQVLSTAGSFEENYVLSIQGPSSLSLSLMKLHKRVRRPNTHKFLIQFLTCLSLIVFLFFLNCSV